MPGFGCLSRLRTCFLFFGDAHNLARLTTPFLKFNVITSAPIVMAPGTRIWYRLRLRGIPISRESEITAWEPPHRFIDEQWHGPFRLWKHQHRFAERKGGTDVSDHLDHAVGGGSIVNILFIAPDVRRIFEYRNRILTELFATALTAEC
jgi:ligand-binding SRPBCC domain-containing protein